MQQRAQREQKRLHGFTSLSWMLDGFVGMYTAEQQDAACLGGPSCQEHLRGKLDGQISAITVAVEMCTGIVPCCLCSTCPVCSDAIQPATYAVLFADILIAL